MIALAVLVLGVSVQGATYVLRDSGRCSDVGLEAIATEAECRAAKESLGYTGNFRSLDSEDYNEGCAVVVSKHVFFHRGEFSPTSDCGSIGSCICVEPSGPEDKGCVGVRRRACKILPYCAWDKRESPKCYDKDPSVKIPIKEFCEVIHVRGWCKKVDGCLWTGKSCMLKSEATCSHLEKRRRCNHFRDQESNCLNGKHCMLMDGNCSTNNYISC